MEIGSKYFPKTAAALAELKTSAALLEENAALSAAQTEQLANTISTLRSQIADKAARIETIIQNLNKAAK